MTDALRVTGIRATLRQDGFMDAMDRVSLRLPEDVVARADRMCSRVFGIPDLDSGGMSRATVLRIAIVRGLDVLEAEFPERRKQPR